MASNSSSDLLLKRVNDILTTPTSTNKEVGDVLYECCAELLGRWTQYRLSERFVNDDGDEDDIGWLNCDHESNEWMNLLIGGNILDLIFLIWYQEDYVSGLFHEKIQQNIVIIVMFLAWDSCDRSTTITSRGGIQCLLSVMERFPLVERVQLACMAGLIHLLKNSKLEVLHHMVSLKNCSKNNTTITTTKETTNDDDNGSYCFNGTDSSDPPTTFRLVRNVLQAMREHAQSRSMYEYGCSIFLAGFRRGCLSMVPNHTTARLSTSHSSYRHHAEEMNALFESVALTVYGGLVAHYFDLFLLMAGCHEHTEEQETPRSEYHRTLWVAHMVLVELVGSDAADKLMQQAERSHCHGAAA